MDLTALCRSGCQQSFTNQSCKRKLEHFQEAAAQASAFALPPPVSFAGYSPAFVAKHTAARSTSVDSELSSTSPFPAAKRQCIQSLRPNTPEVVCPRRQPQVNRQALLNKLLVQQSTDSAQRRPQHSQRAGHHLMAAYVHQQRLLQQATPAHASNRQQHRQLPQTQLQRGVFQQHQHQHQHLLQQPQVQLQMLLHQARCFDAQTSCTGQATDNSDLADFVHQVFDIHTQQAQQQEQPRICRAKQPQSQDQLRYSASMCAFISSITTASRQTADAAAVQQQRHLPRFVQCQSRVSLSREQLQHLQHAHHLTQAQEQLALPKQSATPQQGLFVRQLALAVRQQQPVPRSPNRGLADLVIFWAKGLALQRPESLHLACHLWNRVQSQVSIAYMQMLGAEQPWETMLAGCLWLAAKLEECRRGVPTASRMGLLLGVHKSVMGEVELYLMQLVNWAPLRGWQAVCA